MIQTISLSPGVELSCCRDSRFKQGCLSLQLVRPMAESEAALNALLPSVLLRGTLDYPDLRAITHRLDELYGASVSPLVRRVGDYQTTGFYCGFMDDRFALPGDRVLEPVVELLTRLLLDSPLEEDGYLPDFVESEKRNLISTIESELNDKRAYAMGKLLKTMCRSDSYGIPRLGEKDQVAAITPRSLKAHFDRILSESPIRLFYVGSAEAHTVAELLKPLLTRLPGGQRTLAPQTGFTDCRGSHETEYMDIAQGKLCLGYTTPITNRTPDFAAMQIANLIFGGGMTSKLFQNVREKLSLCYYVGSSYYGSKGIVTVSAGIDFDKEDVTRQEIAAQLDSLCRGDITEAELTAAREALLSSLRTTHDSPGAIEGYYSTAALSGLGMTPGEYMAAAEAVTVADAAAAARTLRLHSTYFLRGGSQ